MHGNSSECVVKRVGTTLKPSRQPRPLGSSPRSRRGASRSLFQPAHFLGWPEGAYLSSPTSIQVTHDFLVLHWHALLDDRDEDVPVRSLDQLHLRGNKPQGLQSQRVSGPT